MTRNECLTKQEICACSGLSRYIIGRMVREGKLPPPEICGKYYIKRKVANAFAKMGLHFSDRHPQAEARAA